LKGKKYSPWYDFEKPLRKKNEVNAELHRKKEKAQFYLNTVGVIALPYTNLPTDK